MTTYFVAIRLPGAAIRALEAICPSRHRSLRIVSPERFHLTLRYIGSNLPASVPERLGEVAHASFTLRINGTGTFGSRGRGGVLWAGIEESAELQTVQSQIEAQVVACGCEPEGRPYHPHITLARFSRGCPEERLAEHAAREIDQTFDVREFVLFSSRPVQSGPPEYHIEERYSL